MQIFSKKPNSRWRKSGHVTRPWEKLTISSCFTRLPIRFRSMNDDREEETEDTAPPLPENPYAMLDNMLNDLNIRPDSRHYDEIANLRRASGVSTDNTTEGGDVNSLRRTNPVLANSSPFAVTNSASVICDVPSEP